MFNHGTSYFIFNVAYFIIAPETAGSIGVLNPTLQGEVVEVSLFGMHHSDVSYLLPQLLHHFRISVIH